MSRARETLSRHRVSTFVAVTFALTWAYEFGMVYPLAAGQDISSGASVEVMLAIGAAMFFPSIGVALTRLLTGEGFRDCCIKPRPLRKSFPWFAVAWLMMPTLVAAGAAVYYLLFPSDFDPSCAGMATLLMQQAAAAGVPVQLPDGVTIAQLAVAQIALGVVAGPVLNFLPALGEEWGWRGYLALKLIGRMGFVKAMLVSGVIWGLWHAPITALGHNYGVGYPGFPFAGIAAMTVACVAWGTLLSFVTLKTGSCMAAAFAHGSLNALVAAPAFFSVTGGNPFVGPASTGIVGGIAFLIAVVVVLAVMGKRRFPL